MTVKVTRKASSTTRAKVLEMLHEDKRTVAELARALHITENGIRAQLASLESEGLARQAGVLPGTRKPFNAYELTEAGEKLFPSAYGSLMCELLTVIGDRCSDKELNEICDETARRVAVKFAPGHEAEDFERRLDQTLQVLRQLGGVVEATRKGNKASITGKRCPMGEMVKNRPRTCHLVKGIIASVTGAEVVELCEKGDRPRCHFELTAAKARPKAS